MHILCEGIPKYSPSRIITLLKSITAEEIFRKYLEVKNYREGSSGDIPSYVARIGEGGQ